MKLEGVKEDEHEKLLENDTTIDDFIWEEEEDDDKEKAFNIVQEALNRFMEEIDEKKNRTLTTKRLTHIIYLLIKLIYNHNIDLKELQENSIKYAKRDANGLFI